MSPVDAREQFFYIALSSFAEIILWFVWAILTFLHSCL